MSEWLVVANVLLAGVGALFAILVFFQISRRDAGEAILQHFSKLMRDENDRARQAADDHARNLRQELNDNLRGFQETTLKGFRELGDVLASQIKEFGTRLDVGLKQIDERTTGIRAKLDRDIAHMADEANQHRDMLRLAIETKLDDAAAKQAAAAKDAREEITASFRQLGTAVAETLARAGDQQKERLENVTRSLDSLVEKHEKAQEALRSTVETRLDAIRTANEAKLDEMRKTVDDKLQTTLDERLGQNFRLVTDQLQRVSVGLGEMQQLASGVGDLKRVLTRVRPRGIWGEIQLGALLEDFLAPDQFARNVSVNPISQERVEFAICLPRLSDGSDKVYLAIDAKFPHESFERIVAAANTGTAEEVEEAARGLERTVRAQAKDIASKYIVPPHTTDYAVMFLPSEALYAEVARRPGLVEAITRECAVMIAGPSTLTALVNAIRVGFRSALIHQRAGEISKLLQKVRTEFEKYGDAVQTAYKRAERTVAAVGQLQTRQNVMGRALKGVDLLSADTPADAAAMLLDLETQGLDASPQMDSEGDT